MPLYFKLEAIEPNRRVVIHAEVFEELRVNISKHGQSVPILIYQHGSSFRIIDGEKRWRVIKSLGQKTILAELES
ncbi:MAG: ParB N-terminal domain-containing protein [Desulfohalobiaceae bacterium]